jgi:hypothetical protein
VKQSFPKLFRIVKRCIRIFFHRELYYTSKVTDNDFFVEPDFKKGQYFFSQQTARYIVSLLSSYNNICCLCTPRLAFEWSSQKKNVRLLDIDNRFSQIPGFHYFDLKNPEVMHEGYDIIIADPPFGFTGDELLSAINSVAFNSKKVVLCLIFPIEREKELFGVFKEWKLNRVPVESLKWNNIKNKYNELYGFYSNNVHLMDAK